WLYYFIHLCFFFFQAEDGIRDGHVTGVQTCALPISRVIRNWPRSRSRLWASSMATSARVPCTRSRKPSAVLTDCLSTRPMCSRRSEERRVGKEWRARGWRCRCKKSEDNYVGWWQG